MEANSFGDYAMDIGPMGPIGEGEALILRATRNCPWNRCLFCPAYKNQKFGFRSVTEIKRDIDTVKRIRDLAEEASRNICSGGRMNGEVLQELIHSHPEIYGKAISGLSLENYNARRSLNNVVNWLIHGEKRAFLQDANTPIMQPSGLIEILEYLKKTFPKIEIITSYARSRTCAKRSLSELEQLKQAGLSWLFVGIESGCNEVLRYMEKGVTAEEHIEGGKKVMQAGINLAAFIMPGLAGNKRELAEKHISETIEVLNEIKPTEVRIRSLAILQDSPLYPKWEAGGFDAPNEDQMIDEIRLVIEGLNFDCNIETLQMTNFLFNTRGRLPQIKDALLAKIAQYNEMPPMERLRFRLRRYLYGGYLDIVMQWGRFDPQLGQLIQEAIASLEKGSPDAQEKTERAIFALKSKGIP